MSNRCEKIKERITEWKVIVDGNNISFNLLSELKASMKEIQDLFY
jgi:hypothetical protein